MSSEFAISVETPVHVTWEATPSVLFPSESTHDAVTLVAFVGLSTGAYFSGGGAPALLAGAPSP